MDRKVKGHEQFDFVNGLQENSVGYFTFSNLGLTFGRITNDIKKILLDEAIRLRKEDLKQNDYRSQLAGNLDHEYQFIHMKPLVEPIIARMVAEYERRFNFLGSINVNQNSSQIELSQLWVNFMSRNNFNPPHTHAGVFSFVIWLKIPYNLSEELNMFPKTNTVSASCFSFQPQNILGRINYVTVPIDKNYEGVACLFPSLLNHSVNPFYTSDEERISIAGNLLLQNKV